MNQKNEYPYWKKQKKNTEPKIYRAVSILPVMSKVIERVVHSQVMKHMAKNKIVFNYWSGLKSKCSENFV